MSLDSTAPLVVVGEAMLDIDVVGDVERLCPDAPVPVVDERHELARPGGAALAALLAARGDRPVVLLTTLGVDAARDRLLELLTGVSVVALPGDGGTPVKRRVRAGGQTLLRLDSGGGCAPIERLPTPAEEALQQAAGVLVSDYGRGLTSQPGVRAALEQAARRVPLVWDPHPRGADPVPGTMLATPNLQELGAPDGVPIAVAAAGLRARWGVQALCVTMGDRGALLVGSDASAAELATVAVYGNDTVGAGDAFAAAAGVALAGGTPPEDAAQAGVRAASRHVAAGGAAVLARRTGPREAVATGGPSDLEGVLGLTSRVRERGGTVVATGGCFDLLHAGHVATLRAARQLGDVLVVCLNSDDSVRRLKGSQRPLVGHDDRVAVLSALDCVDGVLVFDQDTPCEVLDVLRPDLWVKGGDYVAGMLPEDEVLARWGGRTVVVPYLPGRSTSELVARARTPASV